jgi:hypothetical protein
VTDMAGAQPSYGCCCHLSRLRKQVRAGFSEAYESTALMEIDPAVGDGAIEPGLVLRGRALQLI